MSAIVSASEHGLVRVFALVRPVDLARGTSLTETQIEDWIGASPLDHGQVQQLWTDDLADMSLSNFLSAGYSVVPDDLTASQAQLEGACDLHPTVIVLVRSSAFTGRPATLTEDGPLHLVATLREQDANVSFEPLPNPDPEAVLEDPPQKKRPSDAAMSGRIATVVLLLMGLLVWLMIWVAG